ncbi:MAG: hypothetical protein RJA36_742 [Pseudomonadota bacterium]|jgi:hypothetical protein
MRPPNTCPAILLLALAGLSCASQADEAAEHPYKLTLGSYRYSDGSTGEDSNLRWQRGDTHAWLGHYRDASFGEQSRVGFDTTLALAPALLLQPSLQGATRGFLGGSANLQIGDPWYAIVGWGRTNLRPYFNLNFDPNDALTLGAGWHGPADQSVQLYCIADDRLHTGQKDWHLLARQPLAEGRRLTLDLLRKTGDGDAGPVRAWGLAATLDYPGWFVRLARDPKQNFSALDATRLSFGLRF